jgi:hypothetical protein
VAATFSLQEQRVIIRFLHLRGATPIEIHRQLSETCGDLLIIEHIHLELEPLLIEVLSSYEVEAEAYCRQPARTLTPGIGARCDPWPYICSMSRPLFFYPSVDPPY